MGRLLAMIIILANLNAKGNNSLKTINMKMDLCLTNKPGRKLSNKLSILNKIKNKLFRLPTVSKERLILHLMIFTISNQSIVKKRQIII